MNHRPNVYCANCKAAKFLMWKLETEGPHKGGMPGEGEFTKGLVKDKKAGIAYAVRCDYFRTPSFFPTNLTVCDAFDDLRKPRAAKEPKEPKAALKVGDRVPSGLVIDVRPPLAQIQYDEEAREIEGLPQTEWLPITSLVNLT
jgi:hypothetical protein